MVHGLPTTLVEHLMHNWLPNGLAPLFLRPPARHRATVSQRVPILIAALLLEGAAAVGAQAPQYGFYTITPCRLIDTRNASGPLGGPALAANTDRSFTITNHCGIPSTADAVSLNVTVTQATASGNVLLYPTGRPRRLLQSTTRPVGREQTMGTTSSVPPAILSFTVRRRADPSS